MEDRFGFKLIAVLDKKILILFKAKGLKIIETIKKVAIHSNVNHKTEKHEGFRSQPKNQSTFYDPHSSYKDIEYIESSRAAAQEIEPLIINDNSFKELILVGNATILGNIRKTLNIHNKALRLREVQKNMVKSSTKEIEKVVFI